MEKLTTTRIMMATVRYIASSSRLNTISGRLIFVSQRVTSIVASIFIYHLTKFLLQILWQDKLQRDELLPAHF